MRPSPVTANPSWASATLSSTEITKSPRPRTATTSSPKASTASINTPTVLPSSSAIRPRPNAYTAALSRNSTASKPSATNYRTSPFWRPNPKQTTPSALPNRTRGPPETSPDNPRASAPTANPSSSPQLPCLPMPRRPSRTPERPGPNHEPANSPPIAPAARRLFRARQPLFSAAPCRPTHLPHYDPGGGCTIVDSRGNCPKSDVVTPDKGWFVPGRQSPSFTFNPLGW